MDNNMKKMTIAAAASLLLICTGCTDATAKLKDSNTTILKVGKTAITKGEVYSSLFGSYGASSAISKATKIICDAEIEVTDDMKQEAQTTLDNTKAAYSEQFTQYLEASGMTEEDYLNDVLIANLQSKELINKYIDENFDSLVEEYQPVKAIVLTFSSIDDTNTALSQLRDGSKTAADIVSEFSLSSTGNEEIITIEDTNYSTTVTSVIRSASPDDGWTQLGGDDGNYYLVKVVENNASNMKDDVETALKSISGISDSVNTYFFKKYDFHVYDINLYNAISSDSTYSGYLVQSKVSSSTSTASSSN